MDKFRILHFTDTHYTARCPISRLERDGYLNALLEKTAEVFELGKKHNVDFYLHSGDFFDSPDISDSVAGKVGSFYLQHKNKDVYVLPGNHDLVGNNINTLNQTKLGLLGKLGVVKIINRYQPIIFEKAGKTLQLSGSPSDFNINDDRSAFILEEKETDFAIHAVHAMLLKEKPNFGSYMPLNSIIDSTFADVTISGHYHLGFDTTIHKNKVFLNPGALARKSALYEEYIRMPKVNLITIDCVTGKIDVKDIVLSSAKKGEEVIDREKLETEKEHNEKVLDFRMSLLKKEFAVNVDLTEVINVIKEESDIEEEVISEALRRLDEANKVLSKTKGENV